MAIRNKLRNNTLFRMLYYGGKTAMQQYHEMRFNPFLYALRGGNNENRVLPYQLGDQYLFQDRQKHHERLCIVLAGYSPELWDGVFQRLHMFAPADTDVCVMTSGLESQYLMALCEKNGWSYLATKHNKLTRIQNLAIYLHPNARYIYKLDEDIFITKGFFDSLYRVYESARCELFYEIGYVAPLIPVNGYGYVRVLERCGLLQDWEKHFGPAFFTDGKHHHTAILEQGAAAEYMWGKTQPVLRDLDTLAKRFLDFPLKYTICPIRFSIGAIMFTREAWLDWGLFPVDWTAGLGLDEEHIASWCLFQGKAAIISENTLVGHLAFGPQKETMMDYYKNHREYFEVNGSEEK